MVEQVDSKQLISIIDDLKNETKTKRINAIQYLGAIAKAMGDDRVKNELIPFINNDLSDDDEDEVILALVESVNQLLDQIPNSHQILLVTAYEQMAKTYDLLVKDKVIQGLKKIYSSYDVKRNESQVLAVIKRLNTDQMFSLKYVVAGLIPFLYPNLSNNGQSEILNIYLSYVNDELSQVRKYAACFLKDLISLMSCSHDNEILFIFQKLSKDEQDFIRILLVDSLIPLARDELLSKQKTNLFNYIKQFSEDNSWRIRYMICDILPTIGPKLDKESQKQIIQYLVNFLQDEEAELKSKAVERLDKYCEFLDLDLVQQKVIPLIKSLSIDYHDFVRISLAKSLLKLAPIFGKQKSNDIILPLFISLIKDTNSEIRINLFQNIDKLIQVIGVESLSSSLMPAIKEQTEDKNWRNKVIVVQHIPFLAKQLKEDYFNNNIIKILIQLLKDNFHEVRTTCIKVIGEIGQIYGQKWIETQVLPKVLPFQTTQNYAHRKVLLAIMSSIIKNVNQDLSTKYIWPVIQSLAKDQVPNVRLYTIKTIQLCYQQMKEKDLVKKIVQSMVDDSDSDVAYLAAETIKKL